MDERTTVGCPKCGRNDAAQKLSVLYAEDAMLHLGVLPNKDLAPPPEPKYPGISERMEEWFKAAVGGTVENVGCLTGMLAFFVLVAAPFVLWGLFTCWLVFTLYGLPFSFQARFPKGFGFWEVPLFIVPPSILLYRISQRKKAFLAQSLPPWRAAVEEWARRFRCDRCGVSFVSDRPMPLSGLPPKTDQARGESPGTRPDTKVVLPAFMGVGKQGRCVVCGKEVHGIRFGDQDFRAVPSEKEPLFAMGVACPDCDALVCRRCKFSVSKPGAPAGAAMAACPRCGRPLADADVLVETDRWYRSQQLVLAGCAEMLRKSGPVRKQSDREVEPQPDTAHPTSPLDCLRSPDRGTRMAGVTQLGDQGAAALSALPELEGLAKSDPDRAVRNRAQWAVEEIRRKSGAA
jgi:hypothetical protein